MMLCRPAERVLWPHPQQSCRRKRRRCWATSWTGAWTRLVLVMRGTRKRTARERKMEMVSINKKMGERESTHPFGH